MEFRKDGLVCLCSCGWISVTKIKEGFRTVGFQCHVWHQVDDLGSHLIVLPVFSFVMWQGWAICSSSSPLILTVNDRISWAFKQISIWKLDLTSKEDSVTIWGNSWDNFLQISWVILVRYHKSPKFLFTSKLVPMVN